MDPPSTPELKCTNPYCPNAPYKARYDARRHLDKDWAWQKNIEQELLIKEVKSNVSTDIIKYILDTHFKGW